MMKMMSPAPCLHLSTVSLHDVQGPSCVLSVYDFVSEGGKLCLLLRVCIPCEVDKVFFHCLNIMLMAIADEKSLLHTSTSSQMIP